MITPEVQEIQAPALLCACKGWLVWRFEDNQKGTKPNKVPYYINGRRRHGVNGSPEDAAQLTDFESAKRFAADNNYTGVGFAFLPEFNVTGLDFDNCVLDGVIDPLVERVTLGTYTEISPSGNGIHAWVQGNLGDRKSGTEGNPFGFELFSTKIWLTFTGNTTELTDLTDCSDTVSDPNEDLTLLIMHRFGGESSIPSFILGNPETMGVDLATLRAALAVMPDNLSYDEWFATGCAVHHETGGSEEGFILWDSWSANSPKYGSEEYGRYKWDSMGKNTTSRPITARSLLKRAHALGANVVIPEIRITPDDFEPIFDILTPYNSGELKSHYNIRTAADFMANIKPISWLIKGFLPKATLGVLYGESGSGKSFVALDICAALGRGVGWNGLRCQAAPCRVLYVVAEGVGGFANRLTAHCHKTGISANDLNVDIISDVIPNLTDGVSVTNLIHDILAREAYDLIVMDTFAQVIAGSDENSGEDMGRALGYCRKINQSTKAMILLVHHSGKDSSKGARGHSSLRGASDVMFEVTRFEDERCIKVIKQKDGIDGAEYGFGLIPVYLGDDEEGDDITSCVVDYHEFVKPAKVKGLGGKQKLIFDTISDFTPGSWVARDHLIDRYLELTADQTTPKHTRKYNFRRAIPACIGVFLEANDTGELRLMHGVDVNQLSSDQ